MLTISIGSSVCLPRMPLIPRAPVGSFEGLLQIKTMMRSFFERFPGRLLGGVGLPLDHGAGGRLRRSPGAQPTWREETQFEVEGVERIEFTADGLIPAHRGRVIGFRCGSIRTSPRRGARRAG